MEPQCGAKPTPAAGPSRLLHLIASVLLPCAALLAAFLFSHPFPGQIEAAGPEAPLVAVGSPRGDDQSAGTAALDALAAAPLAGTDVGGDIVTNTTWTSAGSPYRVIRSITIGPTATLSVEPGVEVRVGNANFDVSGRLVAVGTAAKPITFTADSTGAAPHAGSWGGIRFSGSAQSPNTGSTLSYVTVEYGGTNLSLSYAAVTVTNSTIRNSANEGIRGTLGGVAHLTSTTFTGNAQQAIFLSDGSVNPILSNLQASGNGVDGVALGQGTLNGDHVWEAMGLPYVVGGMAVGVSGTLTIEPGVEIRVARGSRLDVAGALTAIGSAARPITFTGDFRSAPPQSGWWGGLRVDGPVAGPKAGATLSYVTIDSGGAGPQANLAAVRSAITVTNSLVRSSGGDGLNAESGANIRVANTAFVGNVGNALYFADSSVLPELSNLQASGNGLDGVRLKSGSMSSDGSLRAMGLTYYSDGLAIGPGATLTVEPGVEVRFTQSTFVRSTTLSVRGRLIAIGTTTQPITFTAWFGSAPVQAGWWDGVLINGTATRPAVGSVLRYVRIEYAGASQGRVLGNVTVNRGQVAIANSVLRNGLIGLRIEEGGDGSVVENSQILDDTDYGVLNTVQGTTVMAANNWWGAATGPRTENTCNPGANGTLVSAGVAFRPFLDSAGADAGLSASNEALLISIAPERWFVPADGVTRAYARLTLRDGSGRPVSGRTLRLKSTLGSVVDGGLTDAQGQTLAYVTSSTAGDATLTGSLESTAICEIARGPSASITFTPFTSGFDLVPNAAAPYAHSGIEVGSLPFVTGVTTTLRVRLTNPNSFPIAVNGTFGYAQYGIGLVFGPLGEAQNVTIPANGQEVVQVQWAPPLPGHYCLTFDWSARAVGATSAQADGSGRVQRNIDSEPAGDEWGHQAKELAKEHVTIHTLAGEGIGTPSFVGLVPLNFGAWAASTSLGKLTALSSGQGRLRAQAAADPSAPLNYGLIAQPISPTVPPLAAGNGVSAARAAAYNALMAALMDTVAYGQAAGISELRYAAAAQNFDLRWAAVQFTTATTYRKQQGATALRIADRMSDLLAVLRTESISDVAITADDVRAYQSRLRSQGFGVDELSTARQVGLSDADIAELRTRHLAIDSQVATGALLDRLAAIGAEFREVGNVLSSQPTFPAKSSAIRLSADATSSNLVRVTDSSSTFLVGNPLTETTTVELRVRRVDLPPDWQVTVTPITATLRPGEQVTATATIIPGAAAVQGITATVAVEGYASNQLLGGAAVNVLVPDSARALVPAYLPVVLNQLSSGW